MQNLSIPTISPGGIMKFLVVDDSATMRRIIINCLARVGYTDVVEASDGDDALRKFDQSIDFIITDWNMPKMGGLDLAKAVRQTEHGKGTPILMVTARSMREDIMSALQNGIDRYIVKPFTPAVLKDKIDEMTRTSK